MGKPKNIMADFIKEIGHDVMASPVGRYWELFAVTAGRIPRYA